jgi:hypothetical protein
MENHGVRLMRVVGFNQVIARENGLRDDGVWQAIEN